TGSAAALPIWIDVMRAHIDRHGDRANPPAFEAPGNIVFVTLENGVREAFINGTQPQNPMDLRLPGWEPDPPEAAQAADAPDASPVAGAPVPAPAATPVLP